MYHANKNRIKENKKNKNNVIMETTTEEKIAHSFRCRLTSSKARLLCIRQINTAIINPQIPLRNMKSIISLLLVLFVLSPIAPAQDSTGAWQWAHFYTGRDDSFVSNNYITYKDFDADGNVYLLGAYGGDATMDSINGENVSYDDRMVGQNVVATVLLKYDTLGNLVWRKTVKSGDHSTPRGLFMRDSLIYVMGDYDFDKRYNPNLYLFDTMYTDSMVYSIPIEERTPPLRFDQYTYLATLDLDGNVQSIRYLNRVFRGYQINWRTGLGEVKLLNIHQLKPLDPLIELLDLL